MTEGSLDSRRRTALLSLSSGDDRVRCLSQPSQIGALRRRERACDTEPCSFVSPAGEESLSPRLSPSVTYSRIMTVLDHDLDLAAAANDRVKLGETEIKILAMLQALGDHVRFEYQ